MPELLTTRVSVADGWLVLSLVGETDLSVETQLYEIVDAAVEAAVFGVRVDMSEIAFFDSCGIRSLLRGRSRAEQLGRSFIVSPVSPIVAKVLEIAGLDSMLEPGNRTPPPPRDTIRRWSRSRVAPGW